jgi:hypothetical protein
MKTLIIHPKDSSTDFLQGVYDSIRDYTLITSGEKAEVIRQIKNHDRIMMMGHGTPWGLLSVDQFDCGYIIDDATASLLEGKECVFIWCNADKYVSRHSLKGLFSGMFISEVGEALMMGLPLVPQKTVDESNHLFAKVLGQGIERGLFHAYHKTLGFYETLANRNIVAKYNVQRLYLVL